MMTVPEAARQKAFTFSYFMTTAVIVTYFPLYFDSLGFSKMQVGLLYSAGPMIGIAANLFWGLLSDRFRAVKRIINIIFVGQLLTVLCLFGSRSFPVLMGLMIAFFFFQTPTGSLNDSLTMLTVRRTGKSYASFRLFGSLGFAFSALVFGFVLKGTGSQAAIVLPIGTVGLSLLISLTLPNARAEMKRMSFTGLWRIIAEKKLIAFMLAILAISVSHRVNDVYLALYMHKLGASESLVGLSWTVSALSEIPIFYLLARYGDRFKELPLLAFASVIYVVRYLIMSSINHPEWVLLVQLLHSLSFGIYYVTAIRYLQKLVPDEYRSTGQAMFAIVWSSLGGLIGGTVGGWLFDTWGGRELYLFAAGMGALAFVGFAGMNFAWRDRVRNSESFLR